LAIRKSAKQLLLKTFALVDYLQTGHLDHLSRASHLKEECLLIMTLFEPSDAQKLLSSLEVER
jgi:hypothetical protein